MADVTLVTGGTGFLGKSLVNALVERGDAVRILARTSSSLAGLPAENLDIAYGDITDAQSVRDAVRGATRVFHGAAMVKSWARDTRQFDRINVEGLKNMLDAVRADGAVEKVVYTSSFMGLGPSPDSGEPADETLTHAHRHTHNDYERTKYEAMVLARAATDVPLVSLYPGVIYGPGEMTQGNIISTMVVDFLTDRFFLLKKVPGILGDGTGVWNYVYVDDVVRGHVLAMDKGTPGEGYILGGENASLNDFFATLGDITGLAPPKLHLPFWSGKISGAGEELLALLTGRDPFITRAVIDIWKHNWAYTSAKAERELGYSGRSLRDGLAQTVQWIDDAGLVTKRRTA